MKVTTAIELARKYAVCPSCGSERIGGREGAIVIDEKSFMRRCECGWKLHIAARDPAEPCINCPKADWIDMYGVMVFGCDMGFCIADGA